MFTLVLPFVLSLDSFFASVALGASGIRRRRWLGLAVAFGLCDGAAAVARTALGPTILQSTLAVTGAYCAAAVYILAMMFCVSRFGREASAELPWAWLVPVAMSLDNLLAGGGEPMTIAGAAASAVASGVFSVLGFVVGGVLREWWELGVPWFARDAALTVASFRRFKK